MGVEGVGGGAKRFPEDLMRMPVERVRMSTPSTSGHRIVRQQGARRESEDWESYFCDSLICRAFASLLTVSTIAPSYQPSHLARSATEKKLTISP